ncbi:hypothetical protein [Bifidobacterium choerinum]|nr:hypothetical protein [Bifidobacterium choerinum]
MAETTEDMTRTGEALYQWYTVLFENKPLAQYEDNIDALRGLYEMKDTDNNRDELIVAASRIGLPEAIEHVLVEWVNADHVKSDRFPADKGFFSQDIRDLMTTDINVFEAEH